LDNGITDNIKYQSTTNKVTRQPLRVYASKNRNTLEAAMDDEHHLLFVEKDNCTTTTYSYKKLPLILVINTVRTRYCEITKTLVDTDSPLAFKEHLDMIAHCDEPNTHQEKSTYTLFCVTAYSRNKLENSGHYSCFIRPRLLDHALGASWFHFNDDKVTQCSCINALADNFGPSAGHSNDTAYILTYVRDSDAESTLNHTQLRLLDYITTCLTNNLVHAQIPLPPVPSHAVTDDVNQVPVYTHTTSCFVNTVPASTDPRRPSPDWHINMVNFTKEDHERTHTYHIEQLAITTMSCRHLLKSDRS
jgi:hypothetical protein